MIEIDECPNCKANLVYDSIYIEFARQRKRGVMLFKNMTDEEIRNFVINHYGSADAKFYRYIGKYDRDKDRTVSYQCPDCSFVLWEEGK